MFRVRGGMPYCCSVYFRQQGSVLIAFRSRQQAGTNLPDLLLPRGRGGPRSQLPPSRTVRNRMWDAPNALPSSFPKLGHRICYCSSLGSGASVRPAVSSHKQQPFISACLERGDEGATIEDLPLTLWSGDIYSPPVFTLGIEWCLFWAL